MRCTKSAKKILLYAFFFVYNPAFYKKRVYPHGKNKKNDINVVRITPSETVAIRAARVKLRIFLFVSLIFFAHFILMRILDCSKLRFGFSKATRFGLKSNEPMSGDLLSIPDTRRRNVFFFPSKSGAGPNSEST